MPVVTFSKPVGFPIGAVRMLLSQHLPLYKWQCGEDDNGAEKQMGVYHPHILISGRSASSCIFVELRAVLEPMAEPGPPHAWHLVIGEPTTEDKPIADRIKLAIGAAVMFMDEEGARCRFRPGGNWLRVEEHYQVFEHVFKGGDISAADGLGTPAERFSGSGGSGSPRLANLPMADRAPHERSAALGVDTLGLASLQQTFATILNQMGGGELAKQCGFAKPPAFADEAVREDRLPTMVLLVDDLKLIEWDSFADAFDIIDRGGNWSLDGKLDGNVTLAGRGGRITLELVSEPLPDYLLEQAFGRSFWFPDGEPRLRARHHTGQLVMRCDLDTRAAPYEDVRQTAKVATLLLGLVAKHADISGLFNAGVGTIIDTETVVKLTGILHEDEIPIQMWTFAAPHSLQPDAVSFSTGGFAPFLGYEVEIWNAPGDRDFVLGQVNNALRYLLHHGPVVEHGDTMGQKVGDRSIRCFFGDSKAPRATPVKAMFLELRGPETGEPQPDLAPPPDEPAAAGEATGPDAALRLLSQFIDENRRNAGKPIPEIIDDGSIPSSGDAEIDRIIAELWEESAPDVRHALRNMAAAAREGPLVPPPSPSAARPASHPPTTAAAPQPGFGRRTGGFGRKGL